MREKGISGDAKVAGGLLPVRQRGIIEKVKKGERNGHQC